MRKSTGYSIAYVAVNTLPSPGYYRPLYFYTSKDSKYYWGTGNNSYSLESLQNQESQGKIFKLPIPIPLEEGMGMWVNSEGELFYGDLVNPLKSDVKLRFLECKLNP